MQTQEFTTVVFCVSSPTGFVELADEVADQAETFLTMRAADVLAHPHARFLPAEEAAEAWRAFNEDREKER